MSPSKPNHLPSEEKKTERKSLRSSELVQDDENGSRILRRRSDRQSTPRKDMQSTDGVKMARGVLNTSDDVKNRQKDLDGNSSPKAQGIKLRITRANAGLRKEGEEADHSRNGTNKCEPKSTQLGTERTAGWIDRNGSIDPRKTARIGVAGRNDDRYPATGKIPPPRAIRANDQDRQRNIAATSTAKNNQRTRPTKATGAGKEKAETPEKREKTVRTEEGGDKKAATTSKERQGKDSARISDEGKGSKAKVVKKNKVPPQAPGGDLSVIIYNTSPFPEAPNHWSLFCRRYGNMGTISEITGHRRHYEYNELDDKNPRATQRFRQQVPVASISDYRKYITCVREIPIDNTGEQEWNCQNWIMDALEGLYVDDLLPEAEYEAAAERLSGLIDRVGWDPGRR